MSFEMATPQDGYGAQAWRNEVETALLTVSEKQGQDFLGPRGLVPLFERTKSMYGFDQVRASLRTALFTYLVCMRGQKLLVARTPLESQTELFFCLLACGKNEVAFAKFGELTHDRAIARDVTFFERIRNEMAKRERRQSLRKHLSMAILSAWIYGFLWLLSSQDRLILVEQFGFKGKTTLKGLELARKRLGLLGWADFGRDRYPRAPFKLDHSNGGELRLIVPD
jgi:hypothetical protein